MVNIECKQVVCLIENFCPSKLFVPWLFLYKAVFELVATAIAYGVAKDILYFNAWWRGKIAVAVVANLDITKAAAAVAWSPRHQALKQRP